MFIAAFVALGAVDAIVLHHIPRAVNFHPPPDFRYVEANLRQSFRALAAGRAHGDVLELPGVSIASLGVAFQMFNAAFLNGPVATQKELECRLDLAREHFMHRGTAWAFWICEDWLAKPVRKQLTQSCAERRLRLSSELPGMVARELNPRRRALPVLEFRRADGPSTVSDFRSVGEVCFHVPPAWFSEVFHDRIGTICPQFECWVGYDKGLPVATAAIVVSDGAIGLYNIATMPGYRGRGLAEAITRHAAEAALAEAGHLPLILQSTSLGRRMYDKLGFREVTRILVFCAPS